MIAGYLLKESNLAARQPQGTTSVIRPFTSEGLAQGPYVAAIGGVDLATFRTESTDNHHSTKHAPNKIPTFQNLQMSTFDFP